MLLNEEKERIKISFNRAARTYDNYCQLQLTICHKLVAYLKKQAFANGHVADYGCGTGTSTQCLVDQLTFRQLYAIDFANELLEVAKLKLRQCPITFILDDFDKIILPRNSLDLAFSNMALQWGLDLEHSIRMMAIQLKEAGTLAFSIPMQGTFSELSSSRRNVFQERDNIVKIINNLGFTLLVADEKVYVENFISPRVAVQSIKGIGANCLLNRNYKMGLTKANSDAVHSLTYKIGYFVAKKGLCDDG